MSAPSPLVRLLEEAFPAGWRAEAQAAADRIDAGLARSTPADRARIVAEIEAILGRGLCDMQLSDLIAYELGCHLRSADVGLTPSAWLRWLGRRVDEGGERALPSS